ncbi:MAG: SU10 major capsid protein [Bacteroidales bacterium]
MAVLKSFDLNGNKQSFASWISNLSPCDYPFTSMINKEGITQAQYSWQTDALAPADDTTYEEGSQATFQTRASTEILTNFTSILRKVVSVSETAELVATHGRGSETKYQMAKAGKEIMRDLELMNLHSVNGNIGTKNLASKFAGFEGLVGGVGVHDGDTGAIVHKTTIVPDKMVCIPSEAIFDMTYNLYLSGSKADKIMFHPKHAFAFAGLVTSNPDAESTYRMFDGMNTTMNTQVKRIRDPLSRVYTLIPNREMPVDKIYFFNENDWTQTVLRSPSVSKLGKKGASDQYLLEMEVGLRHRHPFASGVLALETKVVHNTFTPAPGLLTSHIGDGAPVSCTTTLDGVAEAGLEVSFHTSNPEAVFFEHPKVKTDGAGKVDNIIRAGNKAGIAQVWTVFRGVKSAVTQINVGEPIIRLVTNDDKPAVGTNVTLTATVHKAGSATPVGNDITVKWYVEPSSNIELNAVSSVTVAGIATVTARVLKVDTTLVQGVLGSVVSNNVILNYTPKPASIEVDAVPNTFLPLGRSDAFAQVVDSLGNPLEGVTVRWSVDPQNLASVNPVTSVTDRTGIAECTLTGQNNGFGQIKGVTEGAIQVQGAGDIFVGSNATMAFTINPNPTEVGLETEFRVELVGQDGVPLEGVEVKIKADVGGELDLTGTTDVFGTFADRVTFLSNSDLVVTATVASFGLSEELDLTFDNTVVVGAPKITVAVSTANGKVGDPTTVTVTYTDSANLPVESANIRFLTHPTWTDGSIPDLRTDENGVSSLNFTATKPGDYKIRAQVTGSLPVVESSAVSMNFAPATP